MRIVWKRLSSADTDRLTSQCNLNFAEQYMLTKFCTGKPYKLIADETTYSIDTIKYYAKKIYEKIEAEI